MYPFLLSGAVEWPSIKHNKIYPNQYKHVLVLRYIVLLYLQAKDTGNLGAPTRTNGNTISSQRSLTKKTRITMPTPTIKRKTKIPPRRIERRTQKMEKKVTRNPIKTRVIVRKTQVQEKKIVTRKREIKKQILKMKKRLFKLR